MTNSSISLKLFVFAAAAMSFATSVAAVARGGQAPTARTRVVEDTVSVAALESELTQIRRDLMELRAEFYQYRVASLEREQEAVSAELNQLQQQDVTLREQLESFDRQFTSALLSADERAQADETLAEMGGRALGEISYRQSALAERLNACERQLTQERVRLDESLARYQQVSGTTTAPVKSILLTK